MDSKFDYAEVQQFFDDHIKWFFDDMSIYDAFANNHPIVSIVIPAYKFDSKHGMLTLPM